MTRPVDGRTGHVDRAAVVHEVSTSDESVRARGYRPIADYAMVGDAQSAALIAGDGAVDWLCLPHFDSPAVLCRLLDAQKGGYLAVSPAEPVVRTLRRYRDVSNVLETVFEIAGGTLVLTDAMPVATGDPGPVLDGVWGGRGRHRLVRLVEAREGPIEVRLDARLGFDFAATLPAIELVPGQGALATDGQDRFLALIWPGALDHDPDGELHGRIVLAAGEQVACVLAFEHDRDDALALLSGEDWRAQVEETDAAWRQWVDYCRADGPYAAAMLRSALTLKMLTFEPTGAVIAAPTTSLPEVIGGVRNWDYRYCWLRDATFTLYALILAGDRTAARAFWHWIERVCVERGAAGLQIMYGVHGERELPERTLDHLSGYRDSPPVRIGNAAAEQRQTDVYGELLDAFWLFYRHGGEDGKPPAIDAEVWGLMRDVADHICQIWRDPDHGLWEVRGEPRHYVYSKVMCWVGLDRAVRFVDEAGVEGDVARWQVERDEIYAEILTRGYDAELGAFTMAYGSGDLDAATLRMPLVGFLAADDPRMRSTIERIERDLKSDGLVRRYDAGDNLPGAEGAFSICSFWLVDCLTALGRLDDATALFERMLGFASDLGLFAEEVDPVTGEALGNYPQAFTHLALIDAGVDLTEALARRAPMPGEATDRAEQVQAGRDARDESGGV